MINLFNQNILNVHDKDKTPVTKYSGLSKIYFKKIIIKIVDLIKKKNPKKVLDFGCGIKKLSKHLCTDTSIECLNFDIKKELSEIDSYKNYDFDFFVANHVVALMEEYEFIELLEYLKSKNVNLKLIFGIGTQSLLAKFLAVLSFNFKSHNGTKISFKRQLEILKEYFDILEVYDIFFITKIYYCRFKN